MALQPTILVPLYIYPLPGAWDPLHAAIAGHPNVNFIIIVNPDSGPGRSRYPDAAYTPQIQKLNAYPNVQTVGYIRLDYGRKKIPELLLELTKYSGWNWREGVPGLALQGIFFDESPHHYSPENAKYMSFINQAVKKAPGLQSNKMIIHNPGCLPEPGLEDPTTDCIVVFEGPHQAFQGLQETLYSIPRSRSQISYIVHSLVTDMSQADLRDYIEELSQHAEFIFLTDLDVNFYESFGPNWGKFLDAAQL